MRRAATAIASRIPVRAAAVVALLAAAACQDLPLPPEVPEAGEPGAPIYTSTGLFERISYAAKGTATYTLDETGLAALALGPDFSVPAVPEISIFLSNSPDLEQAVKVGRLKSTLGEQRWTFKVPRGAVWTWAVLWSEDLWVGVSRARLRPL